MTRKEIVSEFWKYEKDGDCIEGVLISKEENVGEYNSWVYDIETSTGVKSVWGSTVLDLRMKLVKEGQKLCITFKGLGEAKEGKNAPQIFKVEVDDEEKQLPNG